MGIIDYLMNRFFGKKKTEKQLKQVAETKQGQPLHEPEPSKKQISETTRKLIEEIEKAEKTMGKKVGFKRVVKKKVPKKKVKARTTQKYKKIELEEEMKEFRNSIKILGEKIDRLDNRVEHEKIAPKQALGGARVIYSELKSEKKDVSDEIKQTKSLMQFLERDFLKRKINEEMFRRKMFDYREKLHLLSMEKKELLTQRRDLSKTTKSIPQVAPVTLEKLAKTDNLEKLLIKQTETLEKLAEQSVKRTKIEEKVIKAAAPVETERIETAMRFTKPMKKIEAQRGVETQIKKYKIETDFDKILAFVEKKGQVKIGQIAKETGISKKRVDECCKLLRTEKQVDIVYPTFGDAIIQTRDYKERAEMEKIKKNKNKKKGKRD